MTTPNNATYFGGNSNPQRPAATSSGGSNPFTRKLGPLPLWAWMGIGLAIGLAYYFWKQHTSANSSSAQSITSPGSSPDQTTAASQIPQFVNITQNTSPPASPSTTPTTTPSGPSPIQGVPNLIGMTRASAEATLKNGGLSFIYDLGKGQKIAPKTSYVITSQNPPAGTQVQPGQAVQLSIEKEVNYVKSGHKVVPISDTQKGSGD
jgi:PASTA domain